MKCKNCGASYKGNLLKCPYCYTPNHEGIRRQQLRDKKTTLYTTTKEKAERTATPYTKIKLLNVILAITFVIILLLVVNLIVLNKVKANAKNPPPKTVAIETATNQLETLREKKQYSELALYIDSHDLRDETKLAEYEQLHYLYRNLLYFRSNLTDIHKIELAQLSEQDSSIHLALHKAQYILDYKYRPSSHKLYDSNSQYATEYFEEVELSLMTYFFLQTEEIEELFTNSSHEFDAIVPIIIERITEHDKKSNDK